MKSCQGQAGVKALSHNYSMKWTSSTFKRHLAFSQEGDDSSTINLKTMMNVSEHGNFATLGQIHWVIDRTPSFVLIFSLNIFLAFTATLGNTLILIALHKVSSIHPPTKCLFSCLAITDFCVGVIGQPLFAASLMEVSSGNWHIFDLTLSCFNFFCGFSLTTATAISVDRLLALLLGLRYRHTVTLRRVRCLVVCLFLALIVNGFLYSLVSRDFANSAAFVVIIISLFLSVFSHVKIFVKLRQHQAQVRHHVGHEQINGGGIRLNIERYKRTVSTIVWVQLALLFCYCPIFIFLILIRASEYWRGTLFYACASTVVFFNSTLNPILFCWKIREVRQAVKTTVKQICCFSS